MSFCKVLPNIDLRKAQSANSERKLPNLVNIGSLNCPKVDNV